MDHPPIMYKHEAAALGLVDLHKGYALSKKVQLFVRSNLVGKCSLAPTTKKRTTSL